MLEIKDQTENIEWVINFGLVALLPGLSAYSITITNLASKLLERAPDHRYSLMADKLSLKEMREFISTITSYRYNIA